MFGSAKPPGGVRRRGWRVLVVAGITLTFAIGVLVSQTQALPASPAPVCTGQQQFIGNQPPNSVQLLFNCNQTLQSFKVSVDKPLGSTPAGASVESNGAAQPPPQGFACTANSSSPKGYSCSRGANTGNTVRVTEAFQSNPCSGVTTSVTVGTGPLDNSGNPTGTTTTFSAGPMTGCSAPSQSQSTSTNTPPPGKPKGKHRRRCGKHHHGCKKKHHKKKKKK